MSTELYKKHRPKKLQDVVGNSGTVSTLAAKLKKGTLPHCILLTGPSGCGKTTIARILRRELKCSPDDFAEWNVADLRGIDEVRKIRRVMDLAPQKESRIWLLDECHQMSKDAQNAMLKILEDTPDHVYFFLATTDPGKIIPTIRNRAMEVRMSPLQPDDMETLLLRVAKEEGIKLSGKVVHAITMFVNGSSRAALVMLERIAALPEKQQLKVCEEREQEEKESIDLCRAIMKREPWGSVVKILRGLKADQYEQTRRAMLGYARSVFLGGGKLSGRALVVIEEFEGDFFSGGAASLAKACHLVYHAK